MQKVHFRMKVYWYTPNEERRLEKIKGVSNIKFTVFPIELEKHSELNF